MKLDHVKFSVTFFLTFLSFWGIAHIWAEDGSEAMVG